MLWDVYWDYFVGEYVVFLCCGCFLVGCSCVFVLFGVGEYVDVVVLFGECVYWLIGEYVV